MRAVQRRRTGFLAIAAALIWLAPERTLAQSTQPGGITLPGSSSQTCVQVEVPGEKPSAYNCLNQQLQQEAAGSSQPEPNVPLSATSPANQVGTFSKQGISEQYGPNLGKSVIPFRPPPPVFNNALGPTR